MCWLRSRHRANNLKNTNPRVLLSISINSTTPMVGGHISPRAASKIKRHITTPPKFSGMEPVHKEILNKEGSVHRVEKVCAHKCIGNGQSCRRPTTLQTGHCIRATVRQPIIIPRKILNQGNGSEKHKRAHDSVPVQRYSSNAVWHKLFNFPTVSLDTISPKIFDLGGKRSQVGD